MAAEKDSFTQEWVTEGVKPKALFAKWLDGEYHGCMSGAVSTGNPGEEGGTFTAHGGFISGKTLTINAKKFTFTQEWSTLAFPDGSEPSLVEVTLSAEGKTATKVTINHSNIPSPQGKDYEQGWIDKYATPMAAYFTPDTFESHVHPHDAEFTQVSDNFWYIESTFMGDAGKATRNMFVYKLPSGGLFIHGPCALLPKTMEALEALGTPEILFVPNPLHRADSGVYKRRYPDMTVYAPSLAVPKAIEVGAEPCEPADPETEVAEALAAQGVTLRKLPVKEGFEHGVDFDIGGGAVALVFADVVHNNIGEEKQPNKYLFGCEFCVPRAVGLPAIGFLHKKQVVLDWFLALIDEFTPDSPTFGGKTLHALFTIHGPPAGSFADWGEFETITDPLVALRKVARSDALPNTLRAEEGVVISDFLEKRGGRVKSWKKRFAILREDGTLTYHVDDKTAKVQGEVDLQPGAVAAPTDDADGRDNALDIVTPGRTDARRWIFSFDAPDKRDAWVDALNHAIEKKTIADILGYWFHAVPEGDDTVMTVEDHAAFWFRQSGHVDAVIKERYSDLFERAITGGLDSWTETDDGLVALILVLDQFGRNIHRGTPRMFDGDEKALSLVRDAIASGRSDALPLYHRFWFSLVLQRSEDVGVSAEVRAFGEKWLADSRESASADFHALGVKLGNQQADLIDRFGRYPVRNAILGRENTPEEEEYLNSDDKAFTTGVAER